MELVHGVCPRRWRGRHRHPAPSQITRQRAEVRGESGQYMTFPYARTLVIAKDGNVHITQKGVDYLVWVARTGHNEDKRL